jgi:hypothetical protein
MFRYLAVQRQNGYAGTGRFSEGVAEGLMSFVIGREVQYIFHLH